MVVVVVVLLIVVVVVVEVLVDRAGLVGRVGKAVVEAVSFLIKPRWIYWVRVINLRYR